MRPYVNIGFAGDSERGPRRDQAGAPRAALATAAGDLAALSGAGAAEGRLV
jgi:hypothetical protein